MNFDWEEEDITFANIRGPRLLDDDFSVGDVLKKPQALPQETVPSPTKGMNLGERIVHVGGRENEAGYIEFGSVMAIDALITHVLRDILTSQKSMALVPVDGYAFESGSEIYQAVEVTAPDGRHQIFYPEDAAYGLVQSIMFASSKETR